MVLIKEILYYRNNKGYNFTIFMIGWDHWIKKRVKHLSSIEGMGIWKTFSVLPKMPGCLFFHYKIVFVLMIISFVKRFTDIKLLKIIFLMYNLLDFCQLMSQEYKINRRVGQNNSQTWQLIDMTINRHDNLYSWQFIDMLIHRHNNL